MNFIPIKFVLKQVLANKKMAAKFSAAELCVVAEKLWIAEMPQLAGKFAVKFLQNGVLAVAVVNSSIAAEMRLAEMLVVGTLKNRRAKIKSVRYSVGKLPETIIPF